MATPKETLFTNIKVLKLFYLSNRRYVINKILKSYVGFLNRNKIGDDKKMKKVFTIITALVFMLCFIPELKTEAVTFQPPFEVNSESAVLYNMDTDSILYSKNADKQQAPAQLTQIMTAIICLENCDDLERVVACPESVFTEFGEYRERYPDIFIPIAELEINEEASIKTLLYAMMLASSTEAAGTIAYHIGNGSSKGFVDMMNKKAQELGCTSTTFTNAHGLYDPKQLTTANDMAKILKYAFTVEFFEEIATASSYEMPVSNMHSEPWTITHTNLMTIESSDYYYQYARGIKTGYGDETGRALATKATQNGNNNIVILLNAPIDDENGDTWYSHIEDAENILEWSFENFSYKPLLTTEQEAQEVKVEYSAGQGFVILKPEEGFRILWDNTVSTSLIETKTEVLENIKAPIYEGDILGKVKLLYAGEVIFETNLLASENVEKSQTKYWFDVCKGFFTSKWFKLAILFGVILSAVYIIYYAYQYRNMMIARKRAEAMRNQARRRPTQNTSQQIRRKK